MEKLPNSGGMDSKPLTTFVHADTRNFREVVQRLTGPSESETTSEVILQKGNIGVKKPAFKLHERRQYRAKLEIIKPIVVSHQFQDQQSFSPSRSWNSSSSPLSKSLSNLSLATSELNIVEEDRAIKERRFFLHPSPRSKPGSSEPELLNLFPLNLSKQNNES